MSSKAIALAVLTAIFVILVIIDGRRKLKNKKQQDEQ